MAKQFSPAQIEAAIKYNDEQIVGFFKFNEKGQLRFRALNMHIMDLRDQFGINLTSAQDLTDFQKAVRKALVAKGRM